MTTRGRGRYDPKRFVVVRPEDQPRRYRSVLSHVEIDLPDDPCRYTIAPNVLPNRGVLAEAGVNVHNVAMSATETIAVNERVLAADPLVELRPAQGQPGDADYVPERPGGIGEEDIITLVLPYVATAREGVIRLGGLLERYGTYESNGIAISDADEIWYVETIGGHHWIARRVPDDCYATIPNQLGIDEFDLDDAFGQRREHMCSADLIEFIERHHLDMAMNRGPHHLDTRAAFGTATHQGPLYNTPRAWYMQRYLNPARTGIPRTPGTRRPRTTSRGAASRSARVSVEDVDFLMSSHFEGTPYEPVRHVGHAGVTPPVPSRRHQPHRSYVAMELMGADVAPAAHRAVMWVSFGSGPFNAVAPFYANVLDTPAYLRDTPAEPSTDSYYWSIRMIAAMADPHYIECSNAIEQYAEQVRSFGHRHVFDTDAALAGAGATDGMDAAAARLTEANEVMAAYLRERTVRLLADVLYTSSNLMRNSFAMSDRWV